MRNHFTALMLSAAVALAGGTLMAQTGGTGSAGNSMGGSSAQGTSDYNPGRPVSPANPNSTTGNTGTTNGNIPTPSSVSGSPSSIGSASLTSTSQTQIEGQLVDVLSASQRGGISGSSSGSTSANLGTSSGTLSSSGGMTGSGSSSSSLSTPSGSTTAVPPANLNGGNTLGTGASRSDIATDRNAGNASGGNTLGNTGTGSSVTAGSGSSSSMTGGVGSSSMSNTSPLSSNSSMSADARQQLNSGIPAAVVSNGQVYILAVDSKSLAAHAGETVRISGRTLSNNLIVPERIEARQGTTGDFREVAFTKPIFGGRTAQER